MDTSNATADSAASPVERAPDVDSRQQFRRQIDGSDKKLLLLIALMLFVGLLIWLSYAATNLFSRDETPKAPASAGALPALRIEQPPRPIAVRDTGADSKYAQLLALMQEKFAQYDKLFSTRQKPKVEAPLASVIYTAAAQHRPFGAPGAGAGAASTPQSLPAELINGVGEPPLRPDPGLDDLLKPSVLPGELAQKVSNRNFLLPQGSNLECVLETAIDTNVPGMVTCILSRDIYSESAKVLLLEKGSKLVGEYRNSIRSGSYRLFLIWNRVLTPQGVAIKLASPGTDTLGRAGLSGFVDNRYLERFGTALLVSIIADVVPAVIQAGVNKTETGQSIDMNMTSTTGAQLGGEILRQNALMPPVLRKNQGDLVSVMVARDLDFSSVYSLRAK